MRNTKILKLDEVCKDFNCVAHSFQQEKNSSMYILYKCLMSKTPKYCDFT